MSDIIEQVREGLEHKIQGLQDALRFVKDPKELERLNADLKGAYVALEKLNVQDTRTPEELEAISKLIKDKADIEAPEKSWRELSPVEKFKYQIELYSKKLVEAYESAKVQYDELSKVCVYLSKVHFDKHPYLETVYKQFKNSLLEVGYSVKFLELQIEQKQNALLAVDEAFDKVDILNRYLNNPMSLPHLVEERESNLGVLKSEQIKNK